MPRATWVRAGRSGSRNGYHDVRLCSPNGRSRSWRLRCSRGSSSPSPSVPSGCTRHNFGILWLLLTCATVMVSFGTLALLGAFGNVGQLLAMVILIYLSLASSGGTVPIQALPSFFRAIGDIEPLRQLLGGARDILYFGCKWHAGLAHALLVIGIELAVWIVLGVGFTSWYDRRKLYRVPPAVIAEVERAVSQALPS